MIPFEQASYRAQVLRLRALAHSALALYPIKVAALDFIHHGENATFKVQASGGRCFLLRIHRGGYHTSDAIQEELRWLEKVARTTDLSIPKPVRSKAHRLLETASHPSITNDRQLCLFEWIDGSSLRGSLTPRHLREIGRVMGVIQKNGFSSTKSTRMYWNADGLIGRKPKWGPIDALAEVSPRDQRLILEARKIVHRKLRAYEQRFPDRLGRIHADMHFGNLLRVKDGIGVIDFDDCGVGFRAYDLVVTSLSTQNILKDKGEEKRLPEFIEALTAGYAEQMPWDRHDEEIFPHLWTARRLASLGWLNSRSDNPRLKAHLANQVQAVVRHLKTL